jgi:hypothetical protein
MSSNVNQKSETAYDAVSISTSSILSEKEKAERQSGQNGQKKSKTSRLVESMSYHAAEPARRLNCVNSDPEHRASGAQNP